MGLGEVLGESGVPEAGHQRKPGDFGGVGGESGSKKSRGECKKWRTQVCHLRRKGRIDYRQD